MINILNNFCDKSSVVRIIKFIKDLINITGIIVPIILVIVITIELVKYLMSNMEKKEAFNKCTKKIIIAVVVFFIPNLINFIFNLAGAQALNNVSCWINANDEMISKLEEIEKNERIAKSNAIKEERKRIAAQQELKKKQLAEARKIAKEQKEKDEAENAKFSSEGLDPAGGKIIYSDGSFSIPATKTSGQAGTKGTGPYGLNKFFWERLSGLINEAKGHGYNVVITSGWRSYESQVATYKSSRRGYAATPGGSRHGWGLAADLAFNGTSCGGNWNCNSAAKFVHDNCGKYGLHFRLTSNPKEPWHIEPVSLVTR